MQTYELLVEGRSVRSNSDDNTLVRTSIGIDQIHVMFDNAEWLEFPLTVTFAQKGVEPVTSSLVVRRISGSSEWAAEATTGVPYEVTGMVGPIRVTFQGTDSNGRHIITAKGEPLRVEEAGDVTLGEVPASAPTVDQWTQAYANATEATNRITSLADSFEADIDERVSAIMEDIYSRVETITNSYNQPATTTSLGLVRVGNGLEITEEGLLSATSVIGITDAQANQISNLAALAYYTFDTNFDDNGDLEDDAMVKASAVPVDGTTLQITDDGKIALAVEFGDGVTY